MPLECHQTDNQSVRQLSRQSIRLSQAEHETLLPITVTLRFEEPIKYRQ